MSSGVTVEKCVDAIKALADHKGSSRVALVKYFKNALHIDNPAAVAAVLKEGVSRGVLTQTGQSFKVKGVEFAEKAEDRVDVERLSEPKDAASAPAKKGDIVHVAYRGTLLDGTEFDKADEFSFELGAGDVIKGWDKGVAGMRVGEKVKLTVPPKMGYGKRGSPPEIPPDATLLFEVTLKRIE